MGEYVTENIDKYDDGDDTIDISEYGGYSDGNEGCEVFTWGIWNYLNFGLLSEHKIQRKFWYRLKLNRGKISKNEEFWFPAEDSYWIQAFFCFCYWILWKKPLCSVFP